MKAIGNYRINVDKMNPNFMLITPNDSIYENYSLPVYPITAKISIDETKWLQTDWKDLAAVKKWYGFEILLNQYLETGKYTFDFDGGELPSGVYFANLQSNKYHKTIKLLIAK